MSLQTCLETSAGDILKVPAATVGITAPKDIDGVAALMRANYASRACGGEVRELEERGGRELDVRICGAIRVALAKLMPVGDVDRLFAGSEICRE